MQRYSRYSDYYPTPLRYQYRYFFPAPVIPITYSSLHGSYNHQCGITDGYSNHTCDTWKNIASRGGYLSAQDQRTAIRDHSLKKALPWRATPSQDVIKDTSFYTGRDTFYNGASDTEYGTHMVDKFPDLVKETNVCASHGNRTYTWPGVKTLPHEWKIHNSQLQAGAECVHNKTTLIKSMADDCVQKAGKKQTRCHLDTNNDIKVRLNEIQTWIDNLKNELKFNIEQSHALIDLKERIEFMIKNVQQPLQISQENLYTRESRQNVELVHDDVEKFLLLEVETLTTSEEKLKDALEKLNTKLTTLRAARHELEKDIQNKEMAKQTDECVEILNELSKDVGPHGAIGGSQDLATSNPITWTQNAQSIIQRSQEERNLSHSLHSEIARTMIKSANDSFGAWNETNRAFSHRIQEILGAKMNLDGKLKKIVDDIDSLGKSIQKVKKSIDEKRPLFELAQTRIDKRKGRPGLELCHDKVSIALLKEIHCLKIELDKLNAQLGEMEETMQKLITTRNNLERDIKLKNMAIFIDREKCLYLRQSFPISTFKECRTDFQTCDVQRSSSIHQKDFGNFGKPQRVR